MMSMHMGIARALGGDGWSQVTHIGGASGGYWFGSQMVYSQSFYDKVLDASLPVEDLLTDWGEGYAHRGVAGRRCGTDHRSVARGRAPFDVSLNID